MQHLIDTINDGFERRESLARDETDLRAAIEEALIMLDSGQLRVAEIVDQEWQVNQWLKRAVLLSFRLADNHVVAGAHSNFFDKVPLKYADYDDQQFLKAGVRVVPDAIVRRGATPCGTTRPEAEKERASHRRLAGRIPRVCGK